MLFPYLKLMKMMTGRQTEPKQHEERIMVVSQLVSMHIYFPLALQTLIMNAGRPIWGHISWTILQCYQQKKQTQNKTKRGGEANKRPRNLQNRYFSFLISCYNNPNDPENPHCPALPPSLFRLELGEDRCLINSRNSVYYKLQTPIACAFAKRSDSGCG